MTAITPKTSVSSTPFEPTQAVNSLDAKTIKTVKSTVPVLQEHGEALTRHFYSRMFTHNPEVKPFFNQTNQTSGKQQKALAGAICAYAANIDNLEALGNAVELIAQKHASLQVRSDQYPIVGSNLLSSIKEVLGEGATEEVINAWGEAYDFLANILIKRESQIYDENAKIPGGWKGFRTFQIAKKEKESQNITSFYLKPQDEKELPIFKAGQYITIRVKTPDGSTTMRNYSLSDKPGTDYFRISVKKEESHLEEIPQGYVSNLLHNELDVGSTIEVGPPCGEFFLNIDQDSKKPIVLISGGVGITPIFSMLINALEKMPHREITFIQGCRNKNVQPFKEYLESLKKNYPKLNVFYRYSDKQTPTAESEIGRIDQKAMKSIIADQDSEYYFCGPQPFMSSIYNTLMEWSVPKDQVHFEFFGPLGTLK